MSFYIKSCLFKEFGRFAKGKKVTVTSYPNIFSKTKFVKEKNLPDFSKIDNKYPIRLQFSNRYNTLKYKESIGPASDAINFKKMCGNEILYNLVNYQYLRRTELLNAFNELSKRIHLPENSEFINNSYNWTDNEICKPVFETVKKMILHTNIKHSLLIAHALDKFNCNNLEFWNLLEKNFDRLLHQIKITQFSFILRYFNKIVREEERNEIDEVISEPIFRGSKEFFHKIYTIIPVHIEAMELDNLLVVCNVMLDQKIHNERLLNYFIYPKLEEKIPYMTFNHFIKMIEFCLGSKFEVRDNI